MTFSRYRCRSTACERSRAALILLGVMLAVVVAGCAKNPRPPADNGALVEMSLTLAGAPLSEAGQLEITYVQVQVHDAAGEPIRFDADNVMSTDGERAVLSVPTDEASLTLFLPEGVAWSFTGRAFDAAGNLLAAAYAQRTTASGTSNVAVLRFVSLLGAARLDTRLPIRHVLPGQEIDLLLAVSPRERPDLIVPTVDYHATYTIENGENLEFSERGVRVRAGSRAGGDVSITGTAAGLRLISGEVAPGEVSATLRLPFSTSIAADLSPPELSNLAFDSEQQVLTGVAGDNYGVVKLEVYDGPVPLASSDPEAMSVKGVPEVVFPGGGTAFRTYLNLPAGDYTLTAVAADFSGNEARADISVFVP